MSRHFGCLGEHQFPGSCADDLGVSCMGISMGESNSVKNKRSDAMGEPECSYVLAAGLTSACFH